MSKVTPHDHILIKNSDHTVVWGNKYFNLDNFIIQNDIQSVGFCEQFHSNILLESTNRTGPKCDAIYTEKFNHALVIKTADCVPVLIKHNDYIFAIHAGWRGLCDEIILKLNTFKPDQRTVAYIGPHIGAQSYEVGQEVINSFINKNDKLDSIINEFASPLNNKFLLNLNRVALLHLTQLGVLESNIHFEQIDTLTDHNWNSYRRDHKVAGRNLSLIIKH